MGDTSLPIYKRGLKSGILTKTILDELINKDQRLATRVPVCVNINAIFIVDLTKVGHFKDLQADGWGVWKQTSTKYHYFKIITNTLMEITEDRYGERNSYKVTRLSYRHANSKDFHRVIIYVDKHDGLVPERTKKAVVQYFFEGDEHAITVSCHGNAKKNITPYHRTFESVKDRIKEELKIKHQPKSIVHNILEEKGGIQNIKASGEHARNRQQISNFKYHSQDGKIEDPLLELMDICKQQAKFPKTAFVREVTASPEMTVFLATEQQLKDIERFCCNNEQFCVLGVDATYNVGQYYLTLTTYRHLMLKTERLNHPVCIGPSIIHQRRLFDSYFSLPSCMIKYNPKLQGVLVYGSDGEKNISDSFDACFVSSTHLLCDIHMTDNIKRKLSELGIKGGEQKMYLHDIFGKQIGKEKISGLVDCFSKDAFDEKLSNLKNTWEERHIRGADFTVYFETYKADLIKNCMRADIRSMCGLGFPPAMYDQNANECANSIIKRDLNIKKLNIKECVDHLHTLVKRQYEEIRLAMIGRGELTVESSYQDLTIEEHKYYQMTRNQKDRLEEKFCCAKVKGNSPVEACRSDMPNNLSIAVEESKIISVPFTILQDIYKKAEVILSDAKGNIVQAPGTTGKQYLVIDSEVADTNHNVRHTASNNQFICDKNCIRWVSYKLCSHTLAAAEHLGKLENFLNWYNTANKVPNFTSLANADMPGNRGKKPTNATKRRKGGNPNLRKEIISNLVEDQNSSEPVPSTSGIAKRTLPNPKSGQFVLTLLQCCHENTTTCHGCKAKFKADGYPDPPADFVVVTKGIRKFTTPSGNQQSKVGNIYFHLNNSCIAEHNSFFYRSLLTIPDDVKPFLNDKHLEFIASNNISL